MIDYIVQKESWYSPIQIIDKFEDVRAVFGEKIYDKVFQRAHEMFIGAVALLGAYELSDENKYFLQSNNQTSTPDVMAGKQVEGSSIGITLELIQMEIVEMEDNAPTDDVVEFLLQTKLAPSKAYTEKDMIVLIINHKVAYNPKEVHERLKLINPKPIIYIIGRPVDAAIGDFIISAAWPKLYVPVHFNVSDTAKKYWIPERIDFNLSTEKKIDYSKSNTLKQVNTYEILGLDRDRIYKKFGATKK